MNKKLSSLRPFPIRLPVRIMITALLERFSVDGRSVYIDLQATAPWTHLPITFPEIKRIEVLKGPASAVYGFNAFDGVVNIITKSGVEMAGTTIQTGYGEFGTLRSAGVQGGGWLIRLSDFDRS